jgi:membrane associated rhomboid family serine protease
LLIPWQVDVPQDRHPFMNWLIVSVILLVFIMQYTSMLAYEQEHPREDTHQSQSMPGWIDNLVLKGWSISGLFGHMWLHGGFLHVAGNLLFLWIFGNAVCSKIGNIKFLPVYIFLGLVAGVFHLIFNGGPMIGASGAIFGVVGLFLVFFPTNDITCYFIWWLLLVPRIWEFTLSSYWIILFWFAYNVLGALLCNFDVGGVAYFAHLGGLFAGFTLGIVMLKTGMVVMEPRYEKSILDVLADRKKPIEPPVDQNLNAFQRDLEIIKRLEARPALQKPAFPQPAANNPPVEERKIKIDEPISENLIHFTCPCGKRVKIPAKFAGKSARCPACKKQIIIPFPDK